MLDAGVRQHVVRLSAAERETLQAVIRKGPHPAGQLLKAWLVLKAGVSKADVSEAGAGWSGERIVQALDTSAARVRRTRQRLAAAGFEAVLRRKPRERPSITPLFDGEAEARLITLARSEAPAGQARWTLRLLEHEVV